MGWNFLDSSGNAKTIQVSLDSTPIGAGVLWFTDTAPAGFLLCQGQSLATANYPELFNVIGYTYGGSGGNFSLPDMRGRGPMGKNAATFATLGAQGGAETHTLSTAELASHQHTQQGTFTSGTESADHSHSGAAGTFGWNRVSNNTTGGSGNTITGIQNSPGVTGDQTVTTGATGGRSAAHTHNTTISGSTVAAGSGNAHNNLQPYHVVHYAIRYTAALPTQVSNELTFNQPGTEVVNGYAEITTNFTSASLAAGARSTAVHTITITGDGVTPMMLEAWASNIYSLTAAGHVEFEIWDGTIGSGTLLAVAQQYQTAAGQSTGPWSVIKRLPAFSGSKTINVAVRNVDGGTRVQNVQCISSTAGSFIRATWAG